MIEALTLGVPVVVPDVGDITTVALHLENAWVVSPPTAEGFAEAVASLLEDAALYTRLHEGALRMRDRFAAEYSLEAAKQAWRGVLARSDA